MQAGGYLGHFKMNNIEPFIKEDADFDSLALHYTY